jgi:hypothetical protein
MSVPLISVSSVDALQDEQLTKIKTWYLQRREYKWMCEQLRKDGYLLNHTRLWHWCKNNLPGHTTEERPRELAPEDRLEMEKLVTSSLLTLCLEAIEGISAPKVTDVEDLNRLANSVARLIASQVQRDRLEYDKKTALEEIKKKYLAEVQRKLADQPEVVAALFSALGSVSDEEDRTIQ